MLAQLQVSKSILWQTWGNLGLDSQQPSISQASSAGFSVLSARLSPGRQMFNNPRVQAQSQDKPNFLGWGLGTPISQKPLRQVTPGCREN